MRNGLLRSTPFRLVFWIAATLVVGVVIAGAVAVWLIREELHARTDRDIANTYNIIAQSFVKDDVQDLVDLIASHVRASAAGDEIYLLLAPDGSQLGGNITAFDFPDGLETVASARLGPADVSGAEYRVLTGTLGGYRLSVGTSLRNVNDVADIVVVALAWAIAGFALVVGIIGLLAASSGQRRLDSIATTMGLVARGDLKARIPLSGRGDDIDELVGSVNAALDRLAALVEGMRQVSTDIAHELKTPLNRLSIAVANATEAAGEASELSPLLDEAQNEIRQVISIFDAMLRIAQIEAGARRARFGPVQLGNILENVAEAYGPVAADNGQRLTLAINDTLGCVDGDKDLLTQAIANLLENALRHCPQGTLITLEGRIESGHPTVTVADTGPGIPDADKPRVFDRLYRVEKSRTTQGNGLGLSLVKAVADLHNATIALADNYPGLIVKIVFECRES